MVLGMEVQIPLKMNLDGILPKDLEIMMCVSKI